MLQKPKPYNHAERGTLEFQEKEILKIMERESAFKVTSDARFSVSVSLTAGFILQIRSKQHLMPLHNRRTTNEKFQQHDII